MFRLIKEYPAPIELFLSLAKSNRPIGSWKAFNNINALSKAPQILVAGSGTGQHALGTASRFKNSQVTAIDLSPRSLAYAKRKMEELGVTNIHYLQADVLDLGMLDKQFDIIESAGVLHHMADPIAGWKVLTNCLKPGGLIKVGCTAR